MACDGWRDLQDPVAVAATSRIPMTPVAPSKRQTVQPIAQPMRPRVAPEPTVPPTAPGQSRSWQGLIGG